MLNKIRQPQPQQQHQPQRQEPQQPVGQILKKRSKPVLLAPPESLRLLQRRHLPKVVQYNNSSN